MKLRKRIKETAQRYLTIDFHHNKSLKYRLKKILVWLLAISFCFVLLGIITATAVFIVLSQGLPRAEEIRNISFTESTEILDRTGKLLYTIHGEENRDVVGIKDISQHLINATIAMEDQNFYSHRGFYPKRILGALYYKIKGALTGSTQRLAGASTITQQFAKNAFLTSERTLTRKLKELILALRLERAYTKDEIMEMYLNKIPYGNNAYGTERAAQIYFNKHAKDLTLAESAILAALPQAPSRYNPYGDYRYSVLLKEFDLEEWEKRKIDQEADLDVTEFSRGLIGKVNELDPEHKVYIRGRTDLVLSVMYKQGFISEEEKNQAWLETQNPEIFHPYRQSFIAQHFVEYVKRLLEDKYGKEVLEKGGLKVYTTLDKEIQEIAEEVIKERGEYNAKQYDAFNDALLAVQPNTGQILAMVGSRDYYNEEIDGNVNVVLRQRQPGSAFKPFVYALGFTKKYSPASVLYDLKTKFDYRPDARPPENFDGRFEGPITIRRALGQSRNIPAIKMYFLAGGETEIIPFVKKLGIDSLSPQGNYGYPLALGAGEVSMLEMVEGYSVFANNGIHNDVTAILKIENARGEVLEQWEAQEGQEVLNPQVAFLINSILSDQSVRIGHKLTIEGYPNAAKTGTSNKRVSETKNLPTNNWVFNYTPQIVVGAWAGNKDLTIPMKPHADGYDTAGPIAKDFMIRLFKARPQEFSPVDFVIPPGIEKITVSAATGKLPGPLNPPNMLRTDYFASFAKPTEQDNSFVEATIDKVTNEIATPFCPVEQLETKVFQVHHAEDTKYQLWEEAVLAWAYGNTQWSNQLPKDTCHLHTEQTFKDIPTIKIISPLANDEIPTGLVPVQISAPAKHGIDRIEYYLNDRLQYTAKDSPYHGSVRIPPNAKNGDKYRIRVTVYDTLQYKSSTEISVTVKKQASENEENSSGNVPDENAEENSSEGSSGNNENDNENNQPDNQILPILPIRNR